MTNEVHYKQTLPGHAILTRGSDWQLINKSFPRITNIVHEMRFGNEKTDIASEMKKSMIMETISSEGRSTVSKISDRQYTLVDGKTGCHVHFVARYDNETIVGDIAADYNPPGMSKKTDCKYTLLSVGSGFPMIAIDGVNDKRPDIQPHIHNLATFPWYDFNDNQVFEIADKATFVASRK